MLQLSKMNLAHFVVPLVLYFHLCSADAPSSLKLVNLVYRHGDRAPVVLYPNDPYKDVWPQGLGWLTKLGMQEHFALGQWLRNRYQGFLSADYVQTEIEVASSNEDRCLMSAYSNLAGLYPPGSNQTFNKDVLWQPIPVHTRPQNEDKVINMGVPCPRYDELYDETINSAEVQSREKQYKDLYDFLVNKTGMDAINISNVWKVEDALYCEKIHNYTTDWADQMWKNNKTVLKNLRELNAYQFHLLYSGVEKSRLKGGPLLKEMIDNMENRTQADYKGPKLYMFSGHDTTVAALLTTLGLYKSIPESPPYTSTVILELHQDGGEQYYVNIIYKTITDTQTLPLPNCTTNCPLDKFVELTKAEIPVDWRKECHYPNPHHHSSALTKSQIISIALAGLLILTLIMLIYTCVRLRKLRTEPYKMFTNEM